MSVEAKTLDRGSAKLFAIDTHDHEALASAIGLARGSYEVKWWWKYGQPAIDRLQLTVEVDRKHLGETIGKFMEQNGRAVQVTSEVFPYGIVQPDRYRLEVNVQNRV